MTRKDLTDISTYIGSLFMMHAQPFLIYHNIQHTEEVVKHVTEIADHYQLNIPDQHNTILPTIASSCCKMDWKKTERC